jgi:hypothetical protein
VFLVSAYAPRRTACVPGYGLAVFPARGLRPDGMLAADRMASLQALNLGKAEAPA